MAAASATAEAKPVAARSKRPRSERSMNAPSEAAEAKTEESSESLLTDDTAVVAGDGREAADSPIKRVKPSSSAASSSSSAPLSSSSLSAFQSSLANSGLLYFSRLPPHFKPQKLRQLLSCYGVVGRIYCTPEQRHRTRSRMRSASSSASAASVRRFVDGWVEFLDKRVAKAVALTLNGSSLGGSKRGFHYDDLWSCKYLPGFKWQHLTGEDGGGEQAEGGQEAAGDQQGEEGGRGLRAAGRAEQEDRADEAETRQEEEQAARQCRGGRSGSSSQQQQ